MFFTTLFWKKYLYTMNSAETSCIPNDTRINELLYSTTWLWFISVLICPDISVLSRRKPYSNQDYSSSTIRFIFAYFSLIEILRFFSDTYGTSGMISKILIWENMFSISDKSDMFFTTLFWKISLYHELNRNILYTK